MSLLPWHRVSAVRLGSVTKMYWAVGLCVGLLLTSAQGWSETADHREPAKGTIVAAGFGYQIGSVSTITVKMYDASSGDVLSDDTFELNVKEEGSQSHPGQERIFAGGAGLGATDLSNFVLRVYDAKTGKFQWEGQLNLSPQDGSGGSQLVSTLVPRRASVTRIHVAEPAMRQPSFLLRALDGTTGGLVWEDEFSAGAGSARVDRIVDRLTQNGAASAASRTFDFRIRMFDASGQQTLWEDQVVQEEPEEETHEAVDDHAHVLPPWPWLGEQGHPAQVI